MSEEWGSNVLFWVVNGFLISTVITFLVRSVARRYGWIVAPRSDRWHKKPTATYGGIAIYLTVVLISLTLIKVNCDIVVILVGSTWIFLVGLIDDVFSIKPYQKLLGQILGALFIVGNGLVLGWTGSVFVNSAITFFWIVGITNAINLLDNMDGLAAGIAAIAASVIVISLYDVGQPNEVFLLSSFVGSLLGFLVFNFNPASIFMGDCGSLFIGFFLACSVLLSQSAGRSRSVASVVAVPVLTLLVPIFDTTFVTIQRKLSGRSISQGGRDHTSHRLVALGLSERKAVFLLYGLAIVAGTLAVLVRELTFFQSLALIALFGILLVFLGIYLAKVKVYEEETKIGNSAVFGFLVDLSYKRRIFEIFLDVFLISISYYFSFSMLYGSVDEDAEKWEFFIKTLPIILSFKLVAFLVFGVYRGIWRYTTVSDLVTFAKAVFFGSIFSVTVIFFLYEPQEFSRSVFVLDAALLLLALSGSRLMFRVFRFLLPDSIGQQNRRVLIYGAGDGGEMILREIRNNSDLNYLPVGFIDDNPHKQGKTIHGLEVFGSNGVLADICKERDVQGIIISCRKMDPRNLQHVKKFCKEANLMLKRAELRIEDVELE